MIFNSAYKHIFLGIDYYYELVISIPLIKYYYILWSIV